MVNSVFKVHYVSAQNCFIYLPQTGFKNTIKSGPKLKVYSVQRFDSNENKPIGYLSAQLSTSLPEGSVGLNAMYAKLLDIPENSTICLSEVPRTPPVAQVFITPVSEEDFEILENCANVVEECLLSQLQVVWPNQIFPIWISKSLSVRLKVDNVEPYTEVGCLEQFSELVIDCVRTSKTQDAVSNLHSKDNEPSDSAKNTPSTPDHFSKFFKEYFKEEVQSFLSDETISSLNKVRRPFLFRVHPTSALKFLDTLPLISHVFNVFMFRKHLPKLWALRQKPLYLKFTKVPLVLSNDASAKSKEEKIDVPENSSETNSKSGESTFEGVVYVALNIIEDVAESIIGFRQIPHHKCVFASNEVMEMLCLSVSDKIKLEVCDDGSSCINDPTIVFISSGESGNEDQELELQIAAKSYLHNCLEQSSPLLLNRTSFTSVPFHNSNTKISLTISSDKSKLFLLTKESLRHVSFRCIQENPVKFECSLGQDEDSLTLNLDYVYDVHLEKIRSEGKNLLKQSLQLDKQSSFNIFHASNFLITGGPGSGKTTAAKLLLKDLISAPYFVYCKYLSCKTLKGKTFDKIEKALKQCFVECMYHEPAVLFLDDFETIGNAVVFNHDNYPEFLHCNKVSKIFKDLVCYVQSKFSVTVIATASSSVRINEEIMPVHSIPIFTTVFEIPELTKDNRVQILTSLLPKKLFENSCKIDFEALAMKTENYVIQDFSDLCRKLKFTAWKEASVKKVDHFISDDIIKKAVESIVPLGLRGVNLKKDEHISWDSIGGMERIKQSLTEYLIWPSRYPEIFAQNPAKNNSGILLYGMPGTGKTLIASSLVSECQINFISVKGPELLSKFIGASEEGVRNIFKKAESAKPCILFFDEFDSLAPRRGQDNTGVTDRVVNQLLTQLDGVESLNGVTVVAATSRPDLIDPALLRPGRLHHPIHCPLPDEHDRLKILEKLTAELPLDVNVDLSAISKSSENFTGADLRGILYTAQMNAVDELNSEDENRTSSPSSSKITKAEMKITQKHLLSALESTAPSVSTKERQKYQNIYRAFTSSKSDKEDANQTALPQKLILA